MSRSRKAKILFLVTEDWYFLSHRLPVARAARDASMQVVVATNVTDHGDAIRDEGFHLFPLQFRRRSINPLHEARTLIELFRLYRQEQPDLVHHVAIKPVLYGSFIAWLLGIPVAVNALAGLGFVFTSSTWRARLLHPFVCFGLRFFLNRVNGKVIVQNPDDLRALEKAAHVSHERMKVIPGSGVDTDCFLALPEPTGAPITVAMVARMLIDKGVLDLIEAARLLRSQGMSLRVLLFGMPDPENPTSIPKGPIGSMDSGRYCRMARLRRRRSAYLARSPHCCPALLPGRPSEIAARSSGLWAPGYHNGHTRMPGSGAFE